MTTILKYLLLAVACGINADKATKWVLLCISVIISTFLLMVLMITTGCTSTYVEYKVPSGSYLSIHRRSALTRAEMPSVKFNPDGSVEMVGYKTDGGNEAIKAACEGLMKGAIK